MRKDSRAATPSLKMKLFACRGVVGLVAALRSATALLPDSPPRLLSVSAAVLPGLTSPPPLEIVAGAAAQKEGSPQLVLHNVQLVLMNHLTTTKVAAKAKKGSLRPYFS